MIHGEIILYINNQTFTLSLSPVQIEAITKLFGLHRENGELVGYSDEVLQQLVKNTIDKWKVIKK